MPKIASHFGALNFKASPSACHRAGLSSGEWRVGEQQVTNDLDHPPEVGGYKFKVG